MSESDYEVQPGASDGRSQGRHPIFIIGGLVLLGIALALLLFGGDLFGGREAAPVLNQAPTFDESPPVVGQIPNRSSSLLKVGDIAPDFTLNDVEGSAVSLSQFRGQPVMINFWATWCAPCRLEMPDMQAVYEERQDEGLVILALNQDEDPGLVRQFFYDDLGLSFTPLLDQNSNVARAYGVGQFMPTTLFINEIGEVTVIHRGIMSQGLINDYLARTVSDTS